MDIYTNLLNGKTKLAVIGLGYVGLPVAVEFSKTVQTIGFDIDKKKIEKYKSGIDVTKEIGDRELAESKLCFTSDEQDLSAASFYIVAVPTPVEAAHVPDLTIVKEASRTVGRNLRVGDIVVYESTVYPGTTEEVCVPILEKESGLECGTDFKVGYSPERINPSDKVHTIRKIKKIVSGMDPESLEEIAAIYSLIVDAGVYKAESIKVAEAAKVIENSQRDINIAFMNEIAIIFERLGIDTQDVLRAAETKWNFLNFKPGLVGGHCIGVDPYYLTYRAEQAGYHPEVILAGRKINDGMGKFIAEKTIKKIIKKKQQLSNMKVGIMGFTFKENCQDVRNTKVFDLITELREYNIEPIVHDPVADHQEAKAQYGIHLVDFEELKNLDVLIITVGHDEFKKMPLEHIEATFGKENQMIIDVKGILMKGILQKKGIDYWRL